MKQIIFRRSLGSTILIGVVVAAAALATYSYEQNHRAPAAAPASLQAKPVTPPRRGSQQSPAPATSAQQGGEVVPTNDYTVPPVVNGLAPVLSTIPTKQNVVFLGIDDGVNKQPFELAMMKANNIKASLFLANRYIKDKPQFFSDFISAGSLVEDHTVNHQLMSKLTYVQQKQEICDEADLQFQQFGRRPVLFRPPGGDYNLDTRRAAAACGMKAVVQWIAKANGGSMQYQVGNSLRPGDIVLMHFRPEFKADMQAFIKAEQAAGLHTVLLEDWLSK